MLSDGISGPIDKCNCVQMPVGRNDLDLGPRFCCIEARSAGGEGGKRCGQRGKRGEKVGNENESARFGSRPAEGRNASRRARKRDKRSGLLRLSDLAAPNALRLQSSVLEPSATHMSLSDCAFCSHSSMRTALGRSQDCLGVGVSWLRLRYCRSPCSLSHLLQARFQTVTPS